MKYFSYHPESGFELHKTAEEAKKAAEEALDYEREEACDAWSDYVDGICWGELRQRVIETMSRPRTSDDTHVSPDCDTIADYSLVDISHLEKGQD